MNTVYIVKPGVYSNEYISLNPVFIRMDTVISLNPVFIRMDTVYIVKPGVYSNGYGIYR